MTKSLEWDVLNAVDGTDASPIWRIMAHYVNGDRWLPIDHTLRN